MHILAAQRNNVVAAFERYKRYIKANRSRFPRGALELATSDWYFDFRDHRCPHDGWLEALTIAERATGDRHEVRTTEIQARLLGAFHDGYIEFLWTGVSRYQLAGAGMQGGHGDWLYDEFRVSESGGLVHEIEWESGSTRWLIECDDIKYRWLPKNRR